MEESPDLLNLGLLFGQEVDIGNVTTEELPEVLNFQHKLIQEYCAAIFIAKQVRADPSYLNTTFPTLDKIRKYGEVIRFTCGLMAGHARPVINHMGKILARETIDKLNNGDDLMDPYLHVLFDFCQEEGRVSNINPYIS